MPNLLISFMSNLQSSDFVQPLCTIFVNSTLHNVNTNLMVLAMLMSPTPSSAFPPGNASTAAQKAHSRLQIFFLPGQKPIKRISLMPQHTPNNSYRACLIHNFDFILVWSIVHKFNRAGFIADVPCWIRDVPELLPRSPVRRSSRLHVPAPIISHTFPHFESSVRLRLRLDYFEAKDVVREQNGRQSTGISNGG